MCGIVGFFGTKNSINKVFSSLKTIENRGKDSYGVSTDKITFHTKNLSQIGLLKEEDNAVGHCLHSIVNYVPQPLTREGRLVANCEIYNWKEIAKNHVRLG